MWSTKGSKFFTFKIPVQSSEVDPFSDGLGYKKANSKSQNLSPLHKMQGPVVQSIVSLTSLLWVISLTVLANSIYNILISFAEKM